VRKAAEDGLEDRWRNHTQISGIHSNSWLAHGRVAAVGSQGLASTSGCTGLSSTRPSWRLRTYPPSEPNPEGEIHQDIGYLSYDKSRRTFVLRQFHTEGFVNQYVLESMTDDKTNFVFLSEAIENIQAGWRARETYRVISENEFTETFELAPPNGEFAVYTAVTLRK